ncbi:MAG: ATP-binding cassette domain-containing protein [Calditerrivibrio sp.]|nr:ATP-binding cassette domain-containing protein [Calditerrivibrio sp.]
MSVVSVFNLCKSFGDRVLFENVTFSIMKGSKVALFGLNGSGKSTLMKMIVGMEEPDEGKIVISNGTKIGYLQQLVVDKKSIFEFMLDADRRIVDLEEEIGRTADPEKYSLLYDEYDRLGGNRFRSLIREVLHVFDFKEDTWGRSVIELSGGEWERLKLARILVSEASLLLLDEPTNYLDLLMIEWLESFIKKTDKTVLFITHDRKIIENAADEILYLANGTVSHYRMKFSKFLNEIRGESNRILQKKSQLEEEKERLVEFIDRYRAGVKSKQVTARMKMLKKIEEELKNCKIENREIDFIFKKRKEEDYEVVGFDRVVVGYDSVKLTNPISFTIYKGEKVAFVGKNGSGKSTLLRSIYQKGLNILDGQVKVGDRSEIYYFQQILDYDSENTIFDELLNLDVDITVQDIYDLLPKFGFRFDDLYKKLSTLSGGELAKLSLMKIYFLRPNLLLLDEPTNHLDYETVDVLKNALMKYDGTVIMVSHDRYFMEGLVEKYLFFDNKSLIWTYELPSLVKDAPTENNKSYRVEKNRSKKVDKYKVGKLNQEILNLENLLNSLYKEKELFMSEWERLEECLKKIEEIENDLIVKYEELEKMTKEEI